MIITNYLIILPLLPTTTLGTKTERQMLEEMSYKKGLFYLVKTEEDIDSEISSTLIRKRLQQGLSIADLAGPEVEKYIEEQSILQHLKPT